jgi:antitoxin HicB
VYVEQAQYNGDGRGRSGSWGCRGAVGGYELGWVYNKHMKILNFTVVMTPDTTGGYVVTCPALPGLVTEGDSLEEARAMATDAIQGYLESLKKDGEPIPKDESITEQLAIEVA